MYFFFNPSQLQNQDSTRPRKTTKWPNPLFSADPGSLTPPNPVDQAGLHRPPLRWIGRLESVSQLPKNVDSRLITHVELDILFIWWVKYNQESYITIKFKTFSNIYVVSPKDWRFGLGTWKGCLGCDGCDREAPTSGNSFRSWAVCVNCGWPRVTEPPKIQHPTGWCCKCRSGKIQNPIPASRSHFSHHHKNDPDRPANESTITKFEHRPFALCKLKSYHWSLQIGWICSEPYWFEFRVYHALTDIFCCNFQATTPWARFGK